MRNLPFPIKDTARADLETAIHTYQYGGVTKGYDPTTAEIDAVLALYDHYDAVLAHPSDALKGANLAAELRNAIRGAYRQTYEGKPINHVRINAFKGVDLCPICGIDPVQELDHFLPKSIFKPLSLYAWNLVPLCESCNGAKLDQDPSGFLHAYFHTLPDVQFITVEVSISGGGLVANYSIAQDVGLPNDLRTKLNFQMTALSLNARFQQAVNMFMTGQTTGLHMASTFGGAAGVTTYLSMQANVERIAFYRNHWRPVLLSALSAHDEFCNEGFKVVLPNVEPALMAMDLEDA